MKKVEMHCHILPGIDDGAEDMKQSLQMLHIAMEHEIVGAIVTPHGSARDASRERTERSASCAGYSGQRQSSNSM